MVLVSVVKASNSYTPPLRSQIGRHNYLEPDDLSPLTSRNFVPFLRTPSTEHRESLHYHQHQPGPNESELDYFRQSYAGRLPLSTSASFDNHQQIRSPLVGLHYSGSESTLDMPSHPRLEHSPSAARNHASGTQTSEGKENSKRWTFGALFRRKEKTKSPTVPITIQFEPTHRDQSSAALPSPDSASSPESEPRQNFLRRLSKKKKKSSGDGTKAVDGFLKVPSSARRGRQQVYRRSNPDFQSWETTKKCHPMLVSTNNNYSSSGSLSLSMEGSSSLSRGSRANAKDAMKARAEARRESFLIDSSSGEEAEDELGNNGQGSHSSLSLRGNRRAKGTTTSNGRESKSPQIMPLHRVSTPSPNLPNSGSGNGKMAKTKSTIPPSPRWEARIVYTEETLNEDKPVVVRLPKRFTNQIPNDPNGNSYFQTTEMITEENNVITAGLRLPLSLSSSYPKTGEPIYANWRQGNRNQPTGSLTPPPPQRRDVYRPSSRNTAPDFYRPVSCSYIDSHQQPIGNDSTDTTNLSFRPIEYLNSPIERNGHNAGQLVTNDQFQSNWTHYSNNARKEWRPQIKGTIPTYEPQPRRYLGAPVTMTNNSTLSRPEVEKQHPPIINQSQIQQLLSTAHQPVIMSKLGFPVRKLHEKSPSPLTPIHQNNNASEFWKRNDDIKNPRHAFSPSPNFLNHHHQQQGSTNPVRIRSADSSPLSLPKHAKNLLPPHRILRSNESISSLSSFSAETPSPNIFSKNNTNLSSKNPAPSRSTRRIKSPEFKISLIPKEIESRSACERLNVKGYAASPSVVQAPVVQSIPPAVPFILPGHENNGKSPGKNLEDALNELEVMYRSLRLSDEDLLDRAERRDLPTAHQQLRDKDLIPITSPRFFRSSPHCSGSLESLATTSGSGSTDNSRRPRARAPPLRRSGVPDPVKDDMAKRKYDSKETQKVNDPREVVGQSGSYLMLSPAFSPPVSPCPPEQQYGIGYNHHHHDPDLVIDDVAVINIRRANSIRIIEEPQPLFGVPLGPITQAPPSDYLHATPVEKFRPIFRHVKNPDIVKDDQAFRNLRKDLNSENNLSKDWTPKLFSPLKSSITGSTDSLSSYNIQPEANSTGTKKLRAIRSLSANISHLVNPPCSSSSLRQEIGKWNSFTDLNVTNRSSRSLTPARGGPRNYLEPSWVEQANLDDFGIPTFPYRSSSPNSNSTIQKKFKLIQPKLPTPTTQVLSLDPNAPRRPWTDIILQSYEKDNTLEEFRAGTIQEEVRGITSPISEEDNDVFVDALPRTPSISSIKEETLQDMEVASISTFEPSSAAPPIASSHSLLPGQKDRRGSYIDPRSPALISQSEVTTKRRSWSDVPIQYNSYTSAYEAIAGTPKIIFTPLPPPRRVRQISLEGFTGTNDTPSRSEQELNDLINALVKEADTCGESQVDITPAPTFEKIPSEPMETQHKKKRLRHSISDKDLKWQAAIAELESSSTSSQPTTTASQKLKIKKSESKNVNQSSDSEIPISSINIQILDEGLLKSKIEKSCPNQKEVSCHEIEDQSEQRHPSSSFSDCPHEASTKSSSSPSAEASKSKPEDNIPQPQPRGILKKNVEETSSPNPIPRSRSSGFTKTSKKSDCGVSRACLPPWHHQTSTSLESSSGSSPPPSTSKALEKNDEINKKADSPQPIIGRFSIGQLKKRYTFQNESKPSTLEDKESKKVQAQQEKSTLQPDTEEGMNGLRRLLNISENKEDRGKGLKKSPSVGNTPSYWSKISSNQPSFLRKFFEKVSPNPPIGKEKSVPFDPPVESKVEVEAEPILTMNVAQKASHFMKLEHNQRFSKWRNLENSQNQIDEKVTTGVKNQINSKAKVVTNPNFEIHFDTSDKSSSAEIDDRNNTIEKEMKDPTENDLKIEPSRLSLKDRVHMFNRLSTCSGVVHVNSGAAEALSRHARAIPPSSSWNHPSVRMLRGSGSSSSLMRHPTSSVQDIDSSYDNLTAFPLFRNHSTKDFSTSIILNKIVSQGQDLMSQSLPLPNSISMAENNMVKSIRVNSTENNNDYLSEDGEVSSGGMEVAEIISKSYENSPIVRKKPWTSQKMQSSLLCREQWRKYGGLEDNINHWSTATDLPDVNSKFITTVSSTNLGRVTNGACVPGVVRHSIKTTTSNLLPILTALSSSDDQLYEQPIQNGSSKSKSLNSMLWSPPPPPRKKFLRAQEEIQKRVNNNSNAYNSIKLLKGDTENEEDTSKKVMTTNDISDFSSIKRQSDLLIMKKHMPILRRKSSESKYKNPLKALAARMDFNKSPNIQSQSK